MFVFHMDLIPFVKPFPGSVTVNSIQAVNLYGHINMSFMVAIGDLNEKTRIPKNGKTQSTLPLEIDCSSFVLDLL